MRKNSKRKKKRKVDVERENAIWGVGQGKGGWKERRGRGVATNIGSPTMWLSRTGMTTGLVTSSSTSMPSMSAAFRKAWSSGASTVSVLRGSVKRSAATH